MYSLQDHVFLFTLSPWTCVWRVNTFDLHILLFKVLFVKYCFCTGFMFKVKYTISLRCDEFYYNVSWFYCICLNSLGSVWEIIASWLHFMSRFTYFLSKYFCIAFAHRGIPNKQKLLRCLFGRERNVVCIFL